MKHSEILKGHIKQLKFAVWLSQQDLSELREGDWQNLREDLYDFMNPMGGRPQQSVLPPATKEEFKNLSADDITAIQRLIAADLQQYAFNNSGGAISVTVRCKNVEIDFVAFGQDVVFYQLIQSRNLVESARLALGFHLVGAMISPAYIRACADCGQMFLMEKKPRADVAHFHCSIKCARNAATKRYRERMREQIKEQERRRNRRRYETRVRSKPGMSKVKIGKRN